MQSTRKLFIGLIFLLLSQSAMAVFAIKPDAVQQTKSAKEIQKGHFKSNNFVIHKNKSLSLKERLTKRILHQKFKRKFKKKRVEARPSAVISLIAGLLAVAGFIGSIATSFALAGVATVILVVLTGIFAIGALVFGFRALKKDDGDATTKVMAIMGLILGGLAGLIWLIFLIGAAIG